MDGDWQCGNTDCMNHTRMVFAKFSSCPKCGFAKGGERLGDWICPNTTCLNHEKTVWASKAVCPKCGAGKPNSGGKGFPGQFAASGRANIGSQRGGLSGPVHSRGYAGSNPEDWQCPNDECCNHKKGVFARHDTCPKCFSPKPEVPMCVPGQDWQCPNSSCSNHDRGVFGKHDSCPKCFTAKPEAANPVPGTDWQCPNTSCINHRRMVFGKNRVCSQCGSTNPYVDGDTTGTFDNTDLHSATGAARSRSPYRVFR